MIKVGLTGGIGSGKSTVARIFEMLGAPVFYADKEAKVLMASNQEIRSAIFKLLGDHAFSDNSLNREFIADKVFNDPALLEKLNAFVHPVIHQHFLKWADNFTGDIYILEEAAILFESGANIYFDYTILVTSPEPLRSERVMRRDNVNEEKVKGRMKNQFPEKKNLLMADFVIKNDEDSMILLQVLELHERLLSLCRKN
jgi:dephospho-CoA kinase